MSEKVTEHLQVQATPERCYEVIADFESYPDWAADIKHVEIEKRDAKKRPSLVQFRAAAFGRSTNYTLKYDYAKAPEELSWVLYESDSTKKMDGRYLFKEANGSGAERPATDVTYDLEVEMAFPIPGFVKRRAENRIMQTALKELKARAES